LAFYDGSFQREGECVCLRVCDNAKLGASERSRAVSA
jgi:hypothetical protein